MKPTALRRCAFRDIRDIRDKRRNRLGRWCVAAVVVLSVGILFFSGCDDFSAMQQEIEWEATGFDDGYLTVEFY